MTEFKKVSSDPTSSALVEDPDGAPYPDEVQRLVRHLELLVTDDEIEYVLDLIGQALEAVRWHKEADDD